MGFLGTIQLAEGRRVAADIPQDLDIARYDTRGRPSDSSALPLHEPQTPTIDSARYRHRPIDEERIAAQVIAILIQASAAALAEANPELKTSASLVLARQLTYFDQCASPYTAARKSRFRFVQGRRLLLGQSVSMNRQTRG